MAPPPRWPHPSSSPSSHRILLRAHSLDGKGPGEFSRPLSHDIRSHAFRLRHAKGATAPRAPPPDGGPAPHRSQRRPREAHRLDLLDQQAGDRPVAVPLVVARNDVPGRIVLVAPAQRKVIGLHVLVPVGTALKVGRVELVVLLRVIDPCQEALLLGILGNVEESLDHLGAMGGQLGLELIDPPIALLDLVGGGQLVHASDEHILAVRAVEDADLARTRHLPCARATGSRGRAPPWWASSGQQRAPQGRPCRSHGAPCHPCRHHPSLQHQEHRWPPGVDAVRIEAFLEIVEGRTQCVELLQRIRPSLAGIAGRGRCIEARHVDRTPRTPQEGTH